MKTRRQSRAPIPRPEILRVSPSHHGAFDYAELAEWGLRADDVLDFSVNSNPYGPSSSVRDALAHVSLERYPDRESLALRRALSGHLGNMPIARILVGNGTAELLLLLALAYLRPTDSVLVLAPAFGEYERVAALLGADVASWRARVEDGFAISVHEVSECLRRGDHRLAFVCNPNNPTGAMVPLGAISEWALANPATLFVIDEAYQSFAPDCPSALAIDLDNILVLKSMTKDYALAGLRLGYAVGHEAVIAAVARVRPAWDVNALAQAAGLAALSDQAHLERTLAALAREKARLVAGLREIGLCPYPSATHFFLLPVGDGAAFRRELLRRHIQVRDCASFGLPAYVRIATRLPEENDRLLAVLREWRSARSS